MEDICGFWYAFLSKVCEREAKIYPTLNPDVIKGVMINLANRTRCSIGNIGPITQNELSQAFVEVAGFTPNDESAIMLQRLPSLGRISADSPNRQFLDTFILNGLRAESIIQLSRSWDESVLKAEWKNPLDLIGQSILAEYINKDPKRVDIFLTLARKASVNINQVLAADIVAALCLTDTDVLDFRDLSISDAWFSFMSFEGKEIKRLSISNSIIDELDLTNSLLQDSVCINKCCISKASGIASRKSLPEQIQHCEIENYEMMATTTLIKKARLSEPQKIFIEMMRKIFFQPGAGRKEAALLRGMGMSANHQLGEKILNKLLDAGIVTRHKGDEGYIYKPVRSNTARIEKIMTDLTLSKDSLWMEISKI